MLDGGEHAEREFGFGPFRLFPARQLLLEGDRPVRVGSRALVILGVLVERAGELVGKDELISRVWPDTFVEEANLRVHVAALRKALGGGQEGGRYLSNVPGRGYRFVAKVASSDAVVELPPQLSRPEPHHNLPAPLTRMIGREDAVAALVHALSLHRFISIVGPGGIGKTTVAIAVADRLSPVYADSVRFVDLGPLSDPQLVPSAIGSVLGVAVNAADPLPGLVTFLRDRSLLIVLDSCERVVETVASLAEALLKGAPNLHILATSREPLRAEAEHVQRLAPLVIPGTTVTTAEEALRYSSVQLFVERAAATLDGYQLTDLEAPIVADICRRLDGIALAIELAAGRIDAFGVPGLAGRLNDKLRLQIRGRRTALPRHQTLAATLDWSYDTLDDSERTALRELSLFVGNFDLEAARAVMSVEPKGAGLVIEIIANLVAKSLVAADVTGASVRYRLGETARAYAQAKLGDAGQQGAVARRHATFFRDAFQRIENAWNETMPAVTLELYRNRLDDARAALDWSFSPTGDATLGIELTSAMAPLWMHLSLIDECQRRMLQAIGALDRQDAADDRRMMRLQGALGLTLMFTTGAVAKTVAALTHSFDIAQGLGDTEYSLRALWGLWVGRLNNGAISDSLQLAQQFARIAKASPDPLDTAIADRMIGFSMLFLGRPAEAGEHIGRMMSRSPGPGRHMHPTRFQFDQWATAQAALAEVLWLQGFPQQALSAAEASVADAEALGHSVTLCNTLAKSSAVALLAGELEMAERMILRLRREAATHALPFWSAEGGCLAGVLRLRAGDDSGGLAMLRHELRSFPGNTLTVRYIAFLGELALALSANAEFDAAHAAIGEALERSDRNEERWCVAELLRVKGEIAWRDGRPDEAATLFARSLEWSGKQGALAWMLRTSISLARLMCEGGKVAEARQLLWDVYNRFTEGLDTADCRAARHLLDELGQVTEG